ncbi:protein virilizer homolog isoform X1 [Lates japonicus]|uniref:Protein virilizer homolog isoform X1 n=1 Tax=Lates japonicus TaxID=270547 RepID=A0AAD3N223_LATJO|nr:protein virilizer homolog isoform X1 [Lates japonicus]
MWCGFGGVLITEVWVIPPGIKAHSNCLTTEHFGETSPHAFQLELFFNNVTKPNSPTFHRLGSLEYDENKSIVFDPVERQAFIHNKSSQSDCGSVRYSSERHMGHALPLGHLLHHLPHRLNSQAGQEIIKQAFFQSGKKTPIQRQLHPRLHPEGSLDSPGPPPPDDDDGECPSDRGVSSCTVGAVLFNNVTKPNSPTFHRLGSGVVKRQTVRGPWRLPGPSPEDPTCR